MAESDNQFIRLCIFIECFDGSIVGMKTMIDRIDPFNK